MIDEIYAVSKRVKPRTMTQVALKLMEEVGELAQEINIVEGYVNKEQGKDGIVGEAVDSLNCIIDICYLAGISKEEILTALDIKLTKWEVTCYK